MSTNTKPLLGRLLCADKEDDAAAVWRGIAAQTDPEEVQVFWKSLHEAVKQGNLPPSSWSNWEHCATLWPVELRSVLPDLLDSQYPATRGFAYTLLASWKAEPFDAIIRAFEHGYYLASHRYDTACLLDLLRAGLSAQQAARLKPLLQRAHQDEDCRQIYNWICKNKVEKLYEVIAHWLQDPSNQGGIKALASWAGRLDFDLPTFLRGKAADAALDRLDQASPQDAHGLLRVIVGCGKPEHVRKALVSQGGWLDTSAVSQFFGWDHIPDALVAALAQLWSRSPGWWRAQLEEAWRHRRHDDLRHLLHEWEFLAHRRGPPPPLLFGRLLNATFARSRPPWVSQRQGFDQAAAIDPDTLEPLPRFFGMPLADRVSTIEVDRLRFDFLLNHAKIGNTVKPAIAWFISHEFVTSNVIQQILKDEQTCDKQEVEWADAVRHALNQLHEVEGVPLSEESWAALEALRYSIWGPSHDEEHEPEMPSWHPEEGPFWHPEKAYPFWPPEYPKKPGTAPILSSLHKAISGNVWEAYRGAARRLAKRSAEWTARIAEMSTGEFPLRFPQVPCEGVLGEYYWGARQIVLYPLMVEWIARDIAQQTRQQLGSVAALIYQMVQAHEGIHAVVHLGLDTQGKWWVNLAEASLAFHESLTHWLTRLWFLPQLEVPGRVVFAEIEKRLPEIYHFGCLLPDIGSPLALQSVRHFVLRRAALAELPDALKMAARVVGKARRAFENARHWVAPVTELPIPSISPQPVNAGATNPRDWPHLLKWTLTSLALEPLVWQEISSTDPELLQFLTTPNLVECSLFSAVCRSGIAPENRFQVLTEDDVRRHADALVFRHRKEEINQLLVGLTHLDEVRTMLGSNRPLEAWLTRLMQDEESITLARNEFGHRNSILQRVVHFLAFMGRYPQGWPNDLENSIELAVLTGWLLKNGILPDVCLDEPQRSELSAAARGE